jgi:transmembrane sensor
METPKEDTAIHRWLSGAISFEELKAQIPEKDALKYAQIIREVDQWTPDDQSLQLPVLPEKKQKEKAGKVIMMTRWMSIAVAASTVLLMTFGLWFFSSSTQVRHLAEAGQTLTIDFPDKGSKIILAAGSQISWDQDDWDENKRYSELSGTGFFEVEKGGEFMVNTTNGVVRVLGTSFEIKDYDGGLSVGCFTGKVEVISPDDQKRVLLPGLKVHYQDGIFEEMDTFSIDRKPGWIDGRSTFDDAPIAQVISELERLFAIDIDASAIDLNRRYTGGYGHEDSDLALKLVFDPLNISFTRDKNKVFLSE